MSEDCTHDCSSCGETCGERSNPEDFRVPGNILSRIGKVVAVVSGKGGVGKSLVTASLAVAMRRRGHAVGVLDADVTGPSIPKTFGLRGQASFDDKGIYPVTTKTGLEVMSLNLITKNETDPVIWRAPIVSQMVQQFWSEVIWGDLDYMFVDMPPGTGDVPLTVFQSLPLDGIVVVTSPQELVGMIVAKAMKMAELMEVPVLGLVENYSYYQCPDCGGRHSIFGESRIEETAKEHGLEVLAKIPIDPALAAACDSGTIEDMETNYLAGAAEYLEKHLQK
ncbi:MAG: Mrp/NBP35 family ATP-binding protein [Clostridiales bacterium]|nr:Mrp/NBP35 family ATP-binding protein [Clostridiales bacterium]